jgi:superfamily II DNA or RNA helicase
MDDLWTNINARSGGDLPTGDSVQKTHKSKKKDCQGMKITLDYAGATIDLYDLQDLKILKKVSASFTISSSSIGGYIKKTCIYKRIPATMQILFPRFGMLDYAKDHWKNYEIINNIKPGKPPDIEFKWHGEYKNNQPIIVDHILSKFYNPKRALLGKSGLTIKLEAGQGKSFIATGLMATVQQKTLIVCHNRTILYQWMDILSKAYPTNKIGRYYGEHKEDGDIVVGIINSLIMDTMHTARGSITPKKYFSKFGFVVFDEAHEYSSKTRRIIYQRAQSTYMLGLSATPDDRIDGLDTVNTWSIGPVLDAEKLPGYTMDDIPFKGEVSMIKYTGPPEYTEVIVNEALGVVSCPKMITQLSQDPYRIHLIVKTIIALSDKKQNIFVFADRRAYLEKIREELELYEIVFSMMTTEREATEVMRLVGGASSDDMKKAEASAQVILTTFQFMGTGKSIPKMDAIILTTPRRRKSRQYIGRIFRLGSNYDIVRKIIDIVDWATPLKSQWYQRKQYYEEKKFPIIEKKVKYTDLKSEMITMGLLAEDGSVIEVGIDSDNISDVEIDIDIDAELADTIDVSLSTLPDTLRNLESLINDIDC